MIPINSIKKYNELINIYKNKLNNKIIYIFHSNPNVN